MVHITKNERQGRGSGPVATYPLELALEYAAGIIRTHGYISKKNAALQSGRLSTSHILGVWLTGAANPNTLPEDEVKARDALVWLTARFGESVRQTPYASESDFDRSIRLLTQGGYRGVAPSMITKSDFGFVACVYATMERAAGRAVKKAEATESASASEYMGSVKKRAEFFVKLVGKKYHDAAGCYIYKVKDQKGNLGLFFSNDSSVAEVDECFLAKMTPKRHSVSDFHGGKETVFNRVKVIENVGPPTAS